MPFKADGTFEPEGASVNKQLVGKTPKQARGQIIAIYRGL